MADRSDLSDLLAAATDAADGPPDVAALWAHGRRRRRARTASRVAVLGLVVLVLLAVSVAAVRRLGGAETGPVGPGPDGRGLDVGPTPTDGGLHIQVEPGTARGGDELTLRLMGPGADDPARRRTAGTVVEQRFGTMWIPLTWMPAVTAGGDLALGLCGMPTAPARLGSSGTGAVLGSGRRGGGAPAPLTEDLTREVERMKEAVHRADRPCQPTDLTVPATDGQVVPAPRSAAGRYRACWGVGGVPGGPDRVCGEYELDGAPLPSLRLVPDTCPVPGDGSEPPDRWPTDEELRAAPPGPARPVAVVLEGTSTPIGYRRVGTFGPGEPAGTATPVFDLTCRVVAYDFVNMGPIDAARVTSPDFDVAAELARSDFGIQVVPPRLPPAQGGPPVTSPPGRSPGEGEPIGRISVHRLGWYREAIEGRVPPGWSHPAHDPATPRPGEVGNAVLSAAPPGTGPAAVDPTFSVDGRDLLAELRPGDEILVDTHNAQEPIVIYRVVASEPPGGGPPVPLVEVGDGGDLFLAPTTDRRLTLVRRDAGGRPVSVLQAVADGP